MQKNFWSIFKTFFKIGTLLLGGGYVILPLLQSEISEKKGWVNSEEIIEYYALSQSLPGVIAVNISVFVGYKLMGIRGAFAAISGIIFPAFLTIVLIANILGEIVNRHGVKSIFAGVGVGLVIMIILTIKEIYNKTIVDKFTSIIFLIALVLACFGVSPILIIVGSVFLGMLYKLRGNQVTKDL